MGTYTFLHSRDEVFCVMIDHDLRAESTTKCGFLGPTCDGNHMRSRCDAELNGRRRHAACRTEHEYPLA